MVAIISLGHCSVTAIYYEFIQDRVSLALSSLTLGTNNIVCMI